MNRSTSSALLAALLLTVTAHGAFAADPSTHRLSPNPRQTRSHRAFKSGSASVRPRTPIANVWIFPTADSNTVFVRYTVNTSEHLLLVERMKGDQIATLRDFTTEVTSPVTLEARAASQK